MLFLKFRGQEQF